MKHLTDPELIALLREDDEWAFREIYERYWKILYQQALKKLATTEEIRDMIQEIFFSLWKSRHVLILRETLPQYLYTSLRYKIIDYYLRVALPMKKDVLPKALHWHWRPACTCIALSGRMRLPIPKR